MKLYWDLFCSVIDNYGDIGICWRIARELTAEHGQQIRLWVDDLETFQQIWPAISPGLEVQVCEGVEVRRWAENMSDIQPAAVVVEAFACRVPEAYLQAMAVRLPKPVWINLEYFSAEDWVSDCHGLSSPHPKFPLTQYFFIPGLGQNTGGVLGGRSEIAALERFRHDNLAVSDYWSELHVQVDDALRISMFAYENPALSGLIDTLSKFGQQIILLVPEGRVLSRLAAHLGLQSLSAGDCHRQGSLEVRVLPFMPQTLYDRLLWGADINFVRGEDSFVRAQHAGLPMVWQPYVQADGAHLLKLEAFLCRYTVGLSDEASVALQAVWQGWNTGECKPELWAAWLMHMPEYREHARNWAEELKSHPGLVEALVKFVQSSQTGGQAVLKSRL